MDIQELFTDYKDGGDNYILKADSKSRWCGFNKNVIDLLRRKYGTNFNLVLWGMHSESDYYCIPYKFVEHLFAPEHMTKGKVAEQGNERWTAIIKNHKFKMHGNSMYSVNIDRFYGNRAPSQIKGYNEIDEIYGIDYTIEDAKANVKIRLGQSEFRKAVLDNFGHKCCISGIEEPEMLVASHIVPWSVNKNYRSDPSNGLCLFIEYDAYFDKGYITIDEELNILIASGINALSAELKKRLLKLQGKKIRKPRKHRIKSKYITVHHEIVWNHFSD